MAKRIVIETQSNTLFRGVESEQMYDQRGGLCQVGDGDVIVVTNPIDPFFLFYWKNLGLTLPKIIYAGPFDPRYTLSELIINKKNVQNEILHSYNGLGARLEFFWIEETERKLAHVLGIQPYCNFDVSIPFACKQRFKYLCEELGLGTAPWVGAETPEELLAATKDFFEPGRSVLVKASNGTGGLSLGAAKKVDSHENLISEIPAIRQMKAPFVAEKFIDLFKEVSIHWEIDTNGEVNIIALFEQFVTNFSYSGAAFPSTLPEDVKQKIHHDLKERLLPFLLKKEAIGFFCCDILVDKSHGVYWTDFNPRKGAILYIHDMARRVAPIHFGEKRYYFKHDHFLITEGLSFERIYNALGDLIKPFGAKPFVVVTNPGVIPFGGFDITGLSCNSRAEAEVILKQAKNIVHNMK
jgi:hypothetical protein